METETILDGKKYLIRRSVVRDTLANLPHGKIVHFEKRDFPNEATLRAEVSRLRAKGEQVDVEIDVFDGSYNIKRY